LLKRITEHYVLSYVAYEIIVWGRKQLA